MGWDSVLEGKIARFRRLPACLRLALSIATAALLLAPTTPATAASTVRGISSAQLVPAAGHMLAVSLPLLDDNQNQDHQDNDSGAHAARPMHPDELRAAKANADAENHHSPSRSAAPRVPAMSSTASVFNGLNSTGLSAQDESGGATPPDSTGAIGPTRYVEMVNQLVAVYDRSNLALLSQTALAGFVGAPAGVNTSDPQIQWDPQGNRWLYAEIGFATGNNYLVFGWSKTADPSDLANGWCHYGISTGHNIEDYPKLGHDAHFLIVGANVYDDGTGFPFITANVWAIPKPAPNDSTCSSGVSATFFADATHLLKNTDGTLAFTPIPANASDSVTNDYIFGAHDPSLAPQSKVMVWHMESRPNPVLVADGDVTVGTFAIPASAPQPGVSYLLDTLDGRLTQAVAHFDPGIGAEAFWTQQTVAGPGGRSMVRWYEFAPTLASPIVQQGQLASATDFIWNAAISPSIAGRDAAIFYNRGSASLLAAIGAQSRTSSTALGQMDPGEVLLGSSSAADQETAFQGNCTTNPCRWGDYSGASPDPVNAGVVWGSNQLSGPVFFNFAQWTTHNFAISTGQPAGPDFSLAVSPASQTVTAGNSTTYTVNITRSGGFTGAVALTLGRLPTGASGTFNPSSTTGSTSTLTVTTGSGTAAGSSVFTVTGTSGALARTATATLVVQPVPTPDFSLSASPASQTVVQGSGAAYTVVVTASGGFTGTVALSASGLPAGAAATFNPTTVNTSGNSAMSVTTAAATPAGTYTLTIAGASGGLSHTTGATLVVQTAPTPDFSLSATPTSQTVPQGVGTSSTVSVTPSAGFAGAVTLTAGGLPSGAGASFSPNPTKTSSVMSVTTSASTPAGTYTLTITGVSGSLSHSTSVTLVVSSGPCNTPTLTTSAASPYASGAGPITLTATGQCAGGTQFEFYWRDLSNAWHIIGSGYTSSSTAAWNADYKSGIYMLEVDIRPVGSGAAYVTYFDLPFTLSGCGVPSLAPDLASPQAPGTTVHWTATVSCSGTPQYEFYVRSTAGVWSIAQQWGASNTFTWNSPVSAGAYAVEVDVRNAGANEDPYDNYTDVNYSLTFCSVPTLSTSAASPYASGTAPITLTATGQCQGGTQFQFSYVDLGGATNVISSYGSSSTAVWNADYRAGGYTLQVALRPAGSSVAYDTLTNLAFTLTGCGVPALTPDLASPQTPGATVRWTASVTCSGTPQYEFYVRSPANVWTIVQPWAASNTFTWNSPTTGGNYAVEVDVRNAGANEDPYDNYTDVNYSLMNCNTPTLTTSAASPYASGSGPITLTATGQCGGGTQFEFYWRDLSNTWHIIGGGYTSSKTAVWNADYAAGNYMLEVDIRPAGTSIAYATYYDLPFTLSGCGVPTLASDLASPQARGTTVHWTASVSCSGTPQYEFYVRSPAGSWTIVQVWGASNTFTWNSPASAGAYVVEVDARNTGANEDPYDTYLDVPYNLT